MSKFIIEGGYPLKGEIFVSGMKNAATPIIAATLLSNEVSEISNVPEISDVRKVFEILRSMGGKVEKKGTKYRISHKKIKVSKINKNKVKSIRSSILLLGPLLSRYKRVVIPQPGGCIIGNRPIDSHLYVFKKLGAKITRVGDDYMFSAKQLKGSTIILPEFSVTATENAIMGAVLARGKTVIKLAAIEPHVQDLCRFLIKMGANISGLGSHTLNIVGVKKLRGVSYSIIPDQIEAGTFAVAAAVTGGELTIRNIIPEHLDIVLLKLKEAGVNYIKGKNYLKILKSGNLKAFKLQSMPYPGFPTDLQAPFSILATQAKGTSLIHEPLFEARLSHIQELIKMGVNAVICDPHRVLITGPTPLFGTEIKSPDLRAGVTLIIAGLIAKGMTIISKAEVIDRGYKEIDIRLKKIGARIKRVKD